MTRCQDLLQDWFLRHLLGIHEVAQRLGISRQRVPQLADSYKGWPAPAAELKAGKVWNSADIDAWIASHRGPAPPSGRGQATLSAPLEGNSGLCITR
jgi:prophage regulatory protein